MDTFFGPYFYFCLELAPENWAKAHSLWDHDPNHTHLLASFQWSGLSDQWTLRLTENYCSQVWKWCPYRGGGMRFLHPFVLTRVINGPASSADQAVVQTAKAAAMCTACHEYAHPPPPIPPLLLAQNLSLKGRLSFHPIPCGSHDRLSGWKVIDEFDEGKCWTMRSSIYRLFFRSNVTVTLTCDPPLTLLIMSCIQLIRHHLS